MGVLITGTAFYERHEDDIEELDMSLTCDHLLVDASEEISCQGDAIQSLIPEGLGFWAVSFVVEIDYHKWLDRYSGTYEYDASCDLLWSNARKLEQNEVDALLGQISGDQP